MTVTHLNTTDISGGAARAAYRLHQGLRQHGVDSSMFVEHKRSRDPSVERFSPAHDLWTRIRRSLRRRRLRRDFRPYRSSRPGGLEPFSDDRSPYADRLPVALPQVDVYNLHWIRGFVDLGAFFQAVDRPIVWTLHDMNAFTGGCHYTAGCERYVRRCGSCPQLGSNTDDDLSREIWNRKASAYAALDKGDLHIVALCSWMAECVRNSALLSRFPVSVIPNGLDTSLFAPRPAQGLRHALRIDDAARVILFVAERTDNQRKGFSLLASALQSLQFDAPIVLLSVGGHEPELDTPHVHLHFGSIESDELLAATYSAADLFVVPSLQDNLPNTVLEAMACGTPVVGFDTGGIPDMVRPGETGWLAETGNVRDLSSALRTALRSGMLQERGRAARSFVLSNHTLSIQAAQYADLYDALCVP